MKFGGFSLALGAGAALALLLAGTSMESTAGATPDVDSDSVLNLRDNCIQIANPLSVQETQVDSDRDGFGNPCDGDFTGPSGVRNGVVNVQDFTAFLGGYNKAWNAGSPDPGWNADTDMNSNGLTNVQDYPVPGPVWFGSAWSLGSALRQDRFRVAQSDGPQAV